MEEIPYHDEYVRPIPISRILRKHKPPAIKTANVWGMRKIGQQRREEGGVIPYNEWAKTFNTSVQTIRRAVHGTGGYANT